MYTIEQLMAIVKEIVAPYPINKVFLVGSYAKNTATETSDVDLVLEGQELSEAYWDVLFALEDCLSVPVDVMTMRGLEGSVLKETMLEGGMLLYEA